MLHLCDSLFGGQSIPWYIFRSWWLLSQAGLAGHCVCNFDGSLVQLLQGFCSLCKFTPVMFAAQFEARDRSEEPSGKGKSAAGNPSLHQAVCCWCQWASKTSPGSGESFPLGRSWCWWHRGSTVLTPNASDSAPCVMLR